MQLHLKSKTTSSEWVIIQSKSMFPSLFLPSVYLSSSLYLSLFISLSLSLSLSLSVSPSFYLSRILFDPYLSLFDVIRIKYCLLVIYSDPSLFTLDLIKLSAHFDFLFNVSVTQARREKSWLQSHNMWNRSKYRA